MNQTITTLLSHRSIRKFTEQPISIEQLERYIAAGQMASTSSFIQAVTVIRVSESTARKAFAELAGGQPYIESAAEFLVFCADFNRNQHHVQSLGTLEPDYSWTEQFIAATVDVALFGQNVVTAAESEGLGCCYIGGIRNDPEKVTSLLALPELVYPVFGLCLGYPDQDPDIKPRLPLSAVFHQHTYQPNDAKGAVMADYDSVIADYYERRTNGKLKLTFAQQMAKQSATQTRKFMKKYIQNQGFSKR